MKLARIAYRRADAPTNMATDQWMLAMLDDERGIVFRSYGWQYPAFTFGYTQRWAEVTAQYPLDGVEWCRRPSGGGIVDHRNDWTYALAISGQCELGQRSPLDLYRSVHTALSDALRSLGVNSEVYEPQEHHDNPAACFERPSPCDVVFQGTVRKIAGAALKRTKAGVLLQGSVDRACIGDVSSEPLEDRFMTGLVKSCSLETMIETIDTPEKAPGIPAIDQFRSDAWNRRR